MKLKVDQAVTLVKNAREYADRFSYCRFGQALFNSLPKDIANTHEGKETDFFYWLDDEKVLECFYQHYVEQ